MRPSYRTVRELVHRHIGKPAVVLGGGPSLKAQLEAVPPRPEAVYLSANEHGLIATACDYAVCHDKLEERLRPYGVPIVSRHTFADYRILGSIVASTGAVTAWVARVMGCEPIHVLGMDCFQGDATYHHDAEAFSTGNDIPLTVHLNRWRDMLIEYPGPYVFHNELLRTQAVVWKCLGPAPGRAQIESEVGGVWIVTDKPRQVMGEVLPPGRIEVMPHEAARLVNSGFANYD